MFSFIKDNTEEIRERFHEGDCYKYKKDNKEIGLGVINNDENDKIFIYIKKDLRGNGYGKLLFTEVLNELIKRGYEHINVKFGKENIQMLKIVEYNGGLQISTDKKTVKYLIPIKVNK